MVENFPFRRNLVASGSAQKTSGRMTRLRVRPGARSGRDDSSSELEKAFDNYWIKYAGDYPSPVKEFIFQRWKIDRAFPEYQVAVELNGGAGGGYGRRINCHRCGTVVRARRKDGGVGRELRVPYPSHSGQGAERDAAKHNSLQHAGWVSLVFTSAQFLKNPEECIQQIVVELRKAEFRQRAIDKSRSNEFSLTRRELEVLPYLAEGLTYKEVGHKLGIGERTVYQHTQRIREKMKVDSIVKACIMAVVAGVLDYRQFIEY